MPDTKAPGLVIKAKGDGSSVAYWRAQPALIKAGYRPKNVRLHYAPDDPALVARCYALQAEMLAWSGRGPHNAYDGTVAGLANLYQTHRDSPYHDMQQATQGSYSRVLTALLKHKGARRVAQTTGADVRRWYKEYAEASSQSWAYLIVSVFKVALSFGSSLRFPECTQLRQELRDTRFEAGPRRTQQITHAQVTAFRDKAHELGLAWMGRVVTLQFEFAMRRRDIVGQWITDELGTDGIRYGKRVWRDGLLWSNIDANGIVRRSVSKTRKKTGMVAVHAIADYPDVAEDLARTPLEQRVGPIVLTHHGLPPTEAQCRRYFRAIASAAGIPDDIKNMDARAGANTEAYEAGVSEEESMALLTHTQRATNRGYVRDLTEQSRRAAVKRVASRNRISMIRTIRS